MFFQVPEVASNKATYACRLVSSPMTKQNVPVQETALGNVLAVPDWGGSLMCQSLPFQTAALASAPLPVILEPTATHIVGVAQDTSTAPHPVCPWPQKLASFHDFHLWPFQVSGMAPDPLKPVPLTTAHM
jgi:hypothetical protein